MQHLYGPYGTLSAENVRRFRSSEANAVWFHGFDPVLMERAVSAGVAACVEFRTFREDFGRRPDLCPTGVDGEPIRYGRLVQGVCLSRTDFLDEREQALRDGLSRYAPAGVWLDYLTYAGWFETPNPDLQESCFCPDCVAEFNEATGIDATNPHDILANHQSAWTRHKCDRIERFARHYADIIRSARPGTLVGLYACPWYPEEFGGALTRIFGQDLGRLAPVFDVITPLMYANKCGRPPQWSAEYLDRAPGFLPPQTPVAPIVDILDFPANVQALAGIAPYAARAREHVPPGVQVFGGDEIFADPGRVAAFDESVRTMRELEGS